MTELSEANKVALYKRHLRGWLSYAFASEVFVIVSVTLFLPIALEQFARDNGVLMPDKTEPCSSLIQTEVGVAETRCVVKIGSIWVDTASFSLYVYSASVALQALTVISMSHSASRPSYRLPILLIFAAIGSTSATLFLILSSTSSVWWLCALLAICGNVGFGASLVLLNAYIPTLAREVPEVRILEEELNSRERSEPGEAGGTDAEPLLRESASEDGDDVRKRYDIALTHATSHISSLGIALGYGAGIVLLILTLIPVTQLHGTTFSLRLAIGLSGIWWAFFTIPAAIWLPRPLKPDEIETRQTFGHDIISSWKRLISMLGLTSIKRLPNTFRYLLAWFLLSDGFSTITSTAILFAKTSLNMPPSSLILIGVLTPSFGIFGSLVWPYIQRRNVWSNKKVLMLLVAFVGVVPIYGCIGFLDVFKKVGFGGLTTPGEMYALAIYFGFMYGAFQGYARAFYAELIPLGEEARWYALFSITDKSSSFLGPLVVGLITSATGNIRSSFFFLVVMVWVAMPVLWWVNVENGKKDARNWTPR